LGEGTAHDFNDADVVDVEVYRVFGEDGEDGFGDEGGEEIFAAGLFGGDDGADGFAEFGSGSYVFDFVDDEFCVWLGFAPLLPDGNAVEEDIRSKMFRASLCALSYPCTISLAFNPIRNSSSAFFSSSPASTMTIFVASPISASCC